jgi:small Trp-rich protein
MWFAIAGVILVLMKVFEVGPPAAWDVEVTGDLWKFLLPFLLAAIWWAWADGSGLNKRREMNKLDKRKETRRQRNLEALGRGKDGTGKR